VAPAPAPPAPALCGYPYEGAPGVPPPCAPSSRTPDDDPSPPEIRAVLESKVSETSETSDTSVADEAPAPAPSSAPPSPSFTGAENTVSGNATERSSPSPPLVSVPVQGRASAAAESPEPAPAPAPAPPIPNLSAASCNHSGGDRRNDVWFRSTRDAAPAPPGPASPTPSSRPYSSS
jgi:hypothetical protein